MDHVGDVLTPLASDERSAETPADQSALPGFAEQPELAEDL